jgi:hypothetical protein
MARKSSSSPFEVAKLAFCFGANGERTGLIPSTIVEQATLSEIDSEWARLVN